LVREAGFEGARVRGYGDVQLEDPVSMLSIVDRGAGALVSSGVIGKHLAAAFQAGARHRAAGGASTARSLT
jgi:hypothetical protein